MTNVPPQVIELIERFAHNFRLYHRPDYNETQVRVEFIDPLFEALGWDIHNRQGVSPKYQDVIHEATLRDRGAVKAPDYSFRIGPERKFFVEAKKPSVDIREGTHPAYQLRRYGWTAKLCLSVLTDFEEFSVYDCRYPPKPSDKAASHRILYVPYGEYADRWDEIASVFSKESVLKGDFDAYCEKVGGKRGTQEVDQAFLKEIEGWREQLARNIALRNPHLSVRDLNYAVQQTIDRIIFLRICEDRGIEPYEQLKGTLTGDDVYDRLVALFHRADDRYNSGLFHFRAEKGRPDGVDTLTPQLRVDDKVLREFIGDLYYPKSPYEFSVLSADILGNVYEQFLGSTIRLTPAHRAKVEQKPEVRKAGGVYYTPHYIVEYIVQNTVGRLCEDKTPGQIANLRILDPACGSGSFLLGAYEYLLDYHLNWYVENPTRQARKEIYQGRGGEWFLTTGEKKRILLNNLYGVDIDPQAVEVTKLSLLLKVLEDENESQMRLWQERALPDLGRNIKCGNSLIGTDFCEQTSFLDDDEMYRVNPFDWETEFPEIMADGGFDAVIGNPPYIRIQTMKEWSPREVEFYKQRYVSASKGNYDIYVVFVERGLSLLNPNGLLGFILPHKFFNAKYGESLRTLLAQGNHLMHVVHFADQQVFDGATTYTCLMFLAKSGCDHCDVKKVTDLPAWRNDKEGVEGAVKADKITSEEWNFVVGPGADLFERLNEMPVKLGDVAEVFVGLQTSADDVFIMNLVAETPYKIKLMSKILGCEWEFEKDLFFPLVSGTDVSRYGALPRRQYILFPYTVSNEVPKLIEFDSIAKNYPQTSEYLIRNKKRLEDRERGKFKGRSWYRFGRNQNIGIQNRQKLCVPRLVATLYVAYDIDGTHFLDNVDVCGITLRTHYEKQGLPYLVGLLNSKLLRWYFPFVSAPFRGGWLSANRQFLSQLPIRTIDFSDPADVARYDRMVELVQRMLVLHKDLDAARTPNQKNMIRRQIDATDRQIDQLVYELYGLTDEEIRIVETGVS